VTEFDARGFAAVFAANSQFDVWTRFPSEIACDFHQAPDAFAIDRQTDSSGRISPCSPCEIAGIVAAMPE
jgi:hypothetical protein